MKEITTPELKKLIDSREKFVLLDCRSQHYYNWEHIKGARNLRWKYVGEQAEKLFPDKKQLVITYCDGFTCHASIRCFQNLQKAGYTNLIEYSGGIADWKASGLLTEYNSRYKLAANVYRFPDQKFYGESVGSYFVDEKDFVLLVDGPMQLTEEIEDFILHFDKPIKVFMSHGPTAGESKLLQKKYGAKIYLHQADQTNQWLTVKPDVWIADGYEFTPHVKVLHTPGHTPGSAVLYDRKNQLLFSGDHIQGNSKGEIYDFIKRDDGASGDPKERLASVKKLRQLKIRKLLPFHYAMIDDDANAALERFVKKYEHYHH